MEPDEAPIIVGVAQHTARPETLSLAEEPVRLMERVGRAALADTEAPGIAQKIGSVKAVNVISWSYDRAAHIVAERLELPPGERLYSTIGGNTPQWLINATARALAGGEISAALLVGAEAGYTARRAAKQGQALPWTKRDATRESDRVVGDRRPGWGPIEAAHEATLPARVFPLFENALRAALHLPLAEHRRRIAALCARFARVARENPYAWFRDGKDARTISTLSQDNRMIAFPYPKFMNAIIAVDQAAAIVMTTAGVARRLGVPRAKWIYLLGGGDARGTFNISERSDFCSAPALGRAARAALEQARLAVEDLDLVDLYSCFPVAPQFAAREIGLDADRDPPPTVTGGLPYFGGPGNNYTMHAVAAMAERLRRGEGRTGLVYALGWYFAKHAVGIYGKEPGGQAGQSEPYGYEEKPSEVEHCEVAPQADGPGTVEAYTVIHGRDGEPKLGIVAGRLPDARRFVANTPADRELMLALEQEEMVGAAGRVRHDTSSGRNIFSPS